MKAKIQFLFLTVIFVTILVAALHKNRFSSHAFAAKQKVMSAPAQYAPATEVPATVPKPKPKKIDPVIPSRVSKISRDKSGRLDVHAWVTKDICGKIVKKSDVPIMIPKVGNRVVYIRVRRSKTNMGDKTHITSNCLVDVDLPKSVNKENTNKRREQGRGTLGLISILFDCHPEMISGGKSAIEYVNIKKTMARFMGKGKGQDLKIADGGFIKGPVASFAKSGCVITARFKTNYSGVPASTDPEILIKLAKRAAAVFP